MGAAGAGPGARGGGLSHVSARERLGRRRGRSKLPSFPCGLIQSGCRGSGKSLDSQPDGSLHFCARGESTQIVNGIRFDLLDRADLERIVDSFVECGKSHVVHFLAVDPTVRAAQDDAYRRVLNEGDLNIADGQPIAWAIRLRGRRTERIAGTDGVTLLCEGGLRASRSHYLYGGSQLVNERLRFQLRRRHAGIRIVGAEAPPWGMPSERELAASAARIKASGAEAAVDRRRYSNQHYVANRLRELVRRAGNPLRRRRFRLRVWHQAARAGVAAKARTRVVSPSAQRAQASRWPLPRGEPSLRRGRDARTPRSPIELVSCPWCALEAGSGWPVGVRFG